MLLVHICTQLVAAITAGIKRWDERMWGGEQEVFGINMLSLRYLSATQVEMKNSQLDIRIWIWGESSKPELWIFFQHINGINIIRQDDRTEGISVSKIREEIFGPSNVSWLGRWGKSNRESQDDSEEYRYPENQVKRKEAWSTVSNAAERSRRELGTDHWI